jgi:hypothetical protein
VEIDQNTILSFLAEAIDQLRLLPISFARKWSNTSVLHQSEGSSKIQLSSRPDFRLLVGPSISAVERFTESLGMDSRFQRWFRTAPATTQMIRLIQADPGRVGRSLLNDYLYLVSELVYDPAQGAEIAWAFLNSLETGTVSVLYFSPVKGLHLDFNSASLPNDLALRRLTDDECSRLIDQRSELMEDEDLPTHQCLIQRMITIPIQENIPPAHSVREEICAVMTALRLLKSGNVCLKEKRVRKRVRSALDSCVARSPPLSRSESPRSQSFAFWNELRRSLCRKVPGQSHPLRLSKSESGQTRQFSRPGKMTSWSRPLFMARYQGSGNWVRRGGEMYQTISPCPI